MSNFSVSLNLFLTRLKTFIMAPSYLLWWDLSTPSGNSSGFFWYLQEQEIEPEHMLLPHVEQRRFNVLVIKDVFEGIEA